MTSDFVFCFVKAGTGIAELIALEISKKVLINYDIRTFGLILWLLIEDT